MQKNLNVTNVKEARIKSIKKIGYADVYNIQMRKNHNYFANGILISNCDCLRYVCNTMIKGIQTWQRATNTEVDFEELREKLNQNNQNCEISSETSVGQYQYSPNSTQNTSFGLF